MTPLGWGPPSTTTKGSLTLHYQRLTHIMNDKHNECQGRRSGAVDPQPANDAPTPSPAGVTVVPNTLRKGSLTVFSDRIHYKSAIQHYRVLEGETAAELQEQVSAALRKGWKLVGGPTSTPNGICQAVEVYAIICDLCGETMGLSTDLNGVTRCSDCAAQTRCNQKQYAGSGDGTGE